jgi:hypothetical protein
MRLARAMGYPPSWRVVRSLIQVPIPEDLANQMKNSGAAVSTNEGGLHVMTAVRDRIYAGHPASQPDGYYNHASALLACSKMPWRPEYDDVIHDNNDDDYDDDQYCSTSHRNKGGHLKGREAKFGEGDIVEVLYDEDEDVEPEWYEATVLKKVEYQDDIRLVRPSYILRSNSLGSLAVESNPILDEILIPFLFVTRPLLYLMNIQVRCSLHG